MNKSMPEPMNGQVVFCVGPQQRIGGSTYLMTVFSVGHKYFMVSPDGKPGWQATKFHLDTWCEVTDYSPHYHLYVCEQDYLDEQERQKLFDEIRQIFSFHNVSSVDHVHLDTLRTIAGFLRKPTPPQTA